MVAPSIRQWIALGLVGAVAPLINVFGQEAAPDAAPRSTAPIELTLRAPGAGDVGEVISLIADGVQAVAEAVDEVAVEEAQPSEYYIGIALGELPPVAKAQLKLEYGLVVDDVIEGSPAAKAELKPQDILIRVGEMAIDQPADILKAVDEAKDKALRLIVLRDGKELTLAVTPAKRPKPEAGQKVETLEARIPATAIRLIEEALRELKDEDGVARALELYFPRAGVVAQHYNTIKVAELPKHMKISITREGDGPAKIQVEREGQTWDTTDDKLSELPEDVRGQVERMLSQVIHPMLSTRVRSRVRPPQAAGATSPGTPGVRALAPLPAVNIDSVATRLPGTRLHAIRVDEAGLEAKIDQILKKLTADDDGQTLEKLREEVDRLRKEVDALKHK